MENINYEFKDMSTIDVAESVSDNSHMIMEQDGVIKRVPADKLGKVKTVNGEEPDENGNIEVDSVKSWEDLEGKPFYEKESFAYLVEATEYQGSIIRWNKAIEEGKTYILTVGDKEYEGVAFYKGKPYYCTCIDFVGIGLGLLFEGIVLPNEYNGEIVSLKTKTTTIKTLDEKFLPKALQFGEKSEEAVCLTETSYSFPIDKYADGYSCLEFYKNEDDEWFNLQIGKNYIVNWNGELYNVVCAEGVEGDPYIGNEIFCHGTYPFTMYMYNGDSTLAIVSYEASEITKTTVTIGVKCVDSTVVTLDEKYIPNNIPKINYAEVGQTLVVKAIDENGKPTEWETVNVGGLPVYKLSELARIVNKQVDVDVFEDYADLNFYNLPVGSYHIVDDTNMLISAVRFVDENGDITKSNGVSNRFSDFGIISVKKLVYTSGDTEYTRLNISCDTGYITCRYSPNDNPSFYLCEYKNNHSNL